MESLITGTDATKTDPPRNISSPSLPSKDRERLSEPLTTDHNISHKAPEAAGCHENNYSSNENVG